MLRNSHLCSPSNSWSIFSACTVCFSKTMTLSVFSIYRSPCCGGGGSYSYSGGRGGTSVDVTVPENPQDRGGFNPGGGFRGGRGGGSWGSRSSFGGQEHGRGQERESCDGGSKPVTVIVKKEPPDAELDKHQSQVRVLFQGSLYRLYFPRPRKYRRFFFSAYILTSVKMAREITKPIFSRTREINRPYFPRPRKYRRLFSEPTLLTEMQLRSRWRRNNLASIFEAEGNKSLIPATPWGTGWPQVVEDFKSLSV